MDAQIYSDAFATSGWPLYLKHEGSVDDTESNAVRPFWMTRSHFFPDHYTEFERKSTAVATR